VQFPSQLTGIGHPQGPDPMPRHGDLLRRQPAETGIAEVRIATPPQHIARMRTIERQCRPVGRQRRYRHIRAVAVPGQVIQQALLEEAAQTR